MNDFSVQPMRKVGELLRTAREKKGLSLQDCYKFIKIHPKYLAALEESDYSVFSSSVHIKGFIKIYCKLLEINEEEVLAFFRREFDDKKVEHKIVRPIESTVSYITPASVSLVATLVFVIGFFSYLFYQYRTYSGAPTLLVTSPENNLVLPDTKLSISGKTDRDSKVFLNGQELQTSPDGAFKVDIELQEGMNKLSFLAVSRLKKETKIERSVISRKELAAVKGESVEKSRVAVDVSAVGGSSTVKAETDGKVTFEGTMLSGTSRIFEASGSVKLKVSNAGVLILKLNGVSMGAFGKPGEAKEAVFNK